MENYTIKIDHANISCIIPCGYVNKPQLLGDLVIPVVAKIDLENFGEGNIYNFVDLCRIFIVENLTKKKDFIVDVVIEKRIDDSLVERCVLNKCKWRNVDFGFKNKYEMALTFQPCDIEIEEIE